MEVENSIIDLSKRRNWNGLNMFKEWMAASAKNDIKLASTWKPEEGTTGVKKEMKKPNLREYQWKDPYEISSEYITVFKFSLYYEGKMKSSRPSLLKIRDKRSLSNKSWCRRHTV